MVLVLISESQCSLYIGKSEILLFSMFVSSKQNTDNEHFSENIEIRIITYYIQNRTEYSYPPSST